MSTINKKRIEESSTTALKSELLKCGYIDAHIHENDKTPSWDGTVFTYNSKDQKKENLLGRVPIQVKGTANKLISEQVSYSCSVVDLNNYYNDGGCIFFLICVDLSTGWHKLYYTSLLPFDLSSILKSVGCRKTYAVHLKPFPKDDENEIANIFISFLVNRPKQMGIIGKELPTLKSIRQNYLLVSELSLINSESNMRLGGLGKYLSTHDIYLYAKPTGIDIDIPIDKLSNITVENELNCSVSVNGIEYYKSFSIIYKNGKTAIKIGKSVLLLPPYQNKELLIRFRPQGYLSDLIKDGEFFAAVVESKGLSLGNKFMRFDEVNTDSHNKHMQNLEYYKKIKKTLDLLGVTEDLLCDNITPKDATNIRRLVAAVLYGEKLQWGDNTASMVYGPCKISNLSIQIKAKRQADGKYSIENFFSNHDIVIFSVDDIKQEHPLPSSHYLLLEQATFEHASNMNYEQIYESLSKQDYWPHISAETVLLLLRMLKGYDAQENKDLKLLDLAEKVINLVEEKDARIDPDLILLNRLQIFKRKRELNFDEIILLSKFRTLDYPASTRCGAYLLLNDTKSAQKCFDEMSDTEKNDFLKYPICVFGKLEYSNNDGLIAE